MNLNQMAAKSDQKASPTMCQIVETVRKNDSMVLVAPDDIEVGIIGDVQVCGL
jgi:hypothetical protein